MHRSSSNDSKNWTKFPGYYHRISTCVSTKKETYFFQNNKILYLPLPQLFSGQPWILFQYILHSSNRIGLYTSLAPHNSKSSTSQFFAIPNPRIVLLRIRSAISGRGLRIRRCGQLQEAKNQIVSHGGHQSQSRRVGIHLPAATVRYQIVSLGESSKSESPFWLSTYSL